MSSFTIKITRIKHSENIHGGREAADAMTMDAKKNDLILCFSGTVNANFTSVFTKRGQKGVNHDCCIVWEVYKTISGLHFFFVNCANRIMIFTGLRVFS